MAEGNGLSGESPERWTKSIPAAAVTSVNQTGPVEGSTGATGGACRTDSFTATGAAGGVAGREHAVMKTPTRIVAAARKQRQITAAAWQNDEGRG